MRRDTPIAWGRSSGLFEGLQKIKRGDVEEEFQLPFSDISAQLSKEGLYVPEATFIVAELPAEPLTRPRA